MRYSRISVQSIKYVIHHFSLGITALIVENTCKECESLKFHGHLGDLQTPSNKLVSSVKYLEGPFISFQQSSRKHSNNCFLTSKGFTFLFHWDGNFQIILIDFSAWEKILTFERFCLTLQKGVFDQITLEKGKILMEIIISCYKGIFNIKSLANPP